MFHVVTIMVLLGAAVISRSASSEGVPLKGLPSEIRAVIQKDDCPDAKAERGFVKRRDVNTDGVPDYILDYGKLKCGSRREFCGSAGCLTYVFVSLPNGRFIEVLGMNVRELRFPKVRGRSAMRVELHGGTFCNESGADPCSLTTVWEKTKFVFHSASPGYGESPPPPPPPIWKWSERWQLPEERELDQAFR
jgi:hypothetical protein